MFNHLEYEDVVLVDERGETWGKIINGITATHLSEDEQKIYMQSNYFHDPKELYLVFRRMQAVDRGKREVIVDMENEKIIQQPEGNKLRNLQVSGNSIKMELHLESEFNYSIFSSITGANGKQVSSKSQSKYGYSKEKGFEEIELFSTDIDELASPIKLRLSFYPIVQGFYDLRSKEEK